MAIFQGLNLEHGITVIFVTHEPDIAEHTRRVIHIRDGRITADERADGPAENAPYPPAAAGAEAALPGTSGGAAHQPATVSSTVESVR